MLVLMLVLKLLANAGRGVTAESRFIFQRTDAEILMSESAY